MAKRQRIDDFLGPATFRRIAVSVLRPNPHQPRKTFDSKGLARLASSIDEGGQIQPIMVVERAQGSRSLMYIAVGERRVRAHRLLNRPTIMATVRHLHDDNEFDRIMRWYGLVENVGREDLDPIEQAHAYAALMESDGLTQAQVAQLCHVDATKVSVFMGLIVLEESLQAAIARKLADPAIVVSAVRAYNVPDRVQRRMARVLTGGRRKTTDEQRRILEDVLVGEDLTKHGRGEPSAEVIGRRRAVRFIRTLQGAREDALEVATQNDGVVRHALAGMTKGDRMMLEHIIDGHIDALRVIRETIKAIRG